MLLTITDFAVKYGLEERYLKNVLPCYCKHYRADWSPETLYDEDEALEATLSNMCARAREAFKKSQEWEEKAHALEKKLDEMGCYK